MNKQTLLAPLINDILNYVQVLTKPRLNANRISVLVHLTTVAVCLPFTSKHVFVKPQSPALLCSSTLRTHFSLQLGANALHGPVSEWPRACIATVLILEVFPVKGCSLAQRPDLLSVLIIICNNFLISVAVSHTRILWE